MLKIANLPFVFRDVTMLIAEHTELANGVLEEQ